MLFRWSTGGNAKLAATQCALRDLGYDSARVIAWSLPAGTTCPGAGACLRSGSPCFAMRGRYRIESVQRPRRDNLLTVRAILHGHGPRTLADRITADLARMRNLYAVRIHDSGDFFSLEYLEAWALVAAENPTVVFYAYTKSFAVSWYPSLATRQAWPGNFRVTQSHGSRNDNALCPDSPQARVFSASGAVPEGWTPAWDSDVSAIFARGADRLALLAHGLGRGALASAVKSGFVDGGAG